MSYPVKTRYLLTFIAALALLPISPARSHPEHAFIWDAENGMTDLGALVQGQNSIAFGINDNGQVVGFAYVDVLVPHAFLWTEEDGMVDIGTPGGESSAAYSINANGVVVGQGRDVNDELVAFLWTSSGGFVTIGKPGYSSLAYDINDSNWIAGYRYLSVNEYGFIWNGNNGKVRQLGFPPDGTGSVARSINNLNHITGVGSFFPEPEENVFLWTKETGLQDLSRPRGSTQATARAINDHDEIVGHVYGFPVTAFYWSSTTGYVTLQTLSGGGAYAVSINNAGQIAGASTVTGLYDNRAALWADSLSAPQNLGALPGGKLSFAYAINNLGQVVGYSELRE